MALSYAKLAHVEADITADTLTQAAVLASVTAGELKVVNLKGRILTLAELTADLGGGVDGDDLAVFTGDDDER